MKIRLLLILVANIGISHAHDCNTLETLQTGGNDAATATVNGQLLLDNVGVPSDFLKVEANKLFDFSDFIVTRMLLILSYWRTFYSNVWAGVGP